MALPTADYDSVDWKSLTSPEMLCSSCRRITLEAIYDNLDIQISREPCGFCEAIVALCQTLGQTPTTATLGVVDNIASRKSKDFGIGAAIAVSWLGSEHPEEIRQEIRSKHAWTKRLLPLHPWTFALISVRVNGTSHAQGDVLAYLKVIPQDTSGLASSYSAGRVVKPYSKSSAEIIKNWLFECVDSHSHCKKQISWVKVDGEGSTVCLPPRLIDVSSDPPRLCITRGQHGRYAALSYCWGDDAPPDALLIRTSLPLFQEGILDQNLRKTIKDAITVTRDLGITYLWVDSLCILQDDTAEWAAEAPRMGDLYEMAYVTIAALGADSADDGLFLPREVHEPQWKLQIPYSNRKGPVQRSTLTFWPRNFEERDPYAFELENARWRSRAWVLQERLLSRRIVYFGKSQLLWSCKMAKKREDGLAIFPFSTQKNNIFIDNFSAEGYSLGIGRAWLPRFLRRVILFRSSMRSFDESIFSKFWNHVVVDYSSCHLTVATDRERAIQGLALVVSRVTNMTYWLGLWKETIHYGLSWRGTRALPELDLSRHNFASWSWLSKDGPVDFWSRTSVYLVYFPDADPVFDSSSTPAVLSMTVGLFRASRLESLSDKSYQSYAAFDLIEVDDNWPFDRDRQECIKCEPGKCRHSLLVNQKGHVYGLIEFDNESCRRDSVDCIILFEELIKDAGGSVQSPAMKEFRIHYNQRICFLAVEKQGPDHCRRLGTGTACALKETDIKPDEIIEGQRVNLV